MQNFASDISQPITQHTSFSHQSATAIGFSRVDPAYYRCRPNTDHRLHMLRIFARVLDYITLRMRLHVHDSTSTSDQKSDITVFFSDHDLQLRYSNLNDFRFRMIAGRRPCNGRACVETAISSHSDTTAGFSLQGV